MATLREAFVTIRARIESAQLARDAYRVAGSQEKYLEAYSMVEALELQLQKMRTEGLRRS
jgi:hypothetical protein